MIENKKFILYLTGLISIYVVDFIDDKSLRNNF
jgi:hypothetical protein